MDKDEFYELDDNDIEIEEMVDFTDNELEEAENFEEYEPEGLEDFEEGEFEELDDYEEEEPQPFMIAIISLGVVIALLVVIGVIFFIFKSGKEDEKAYVATTETEVYTEDQTVSEIMETETETGVTVEESQATTEFVEVEQTKEVETEQTKEEESEEEQSTIEESTTAILQSEEANVQEPVSGNESMEFTEVSDTVTAKDVTNLRSIPSTLEEGNIVSQLMNGEVIARTGINESYGWSRLDYNGQTVYAVSNYLTTDLNYKPPVTPSNPNRVSTKDGRVIIFTDYSDNVTPKEYVNLRTEPSTSEGESTVRCQIKNGDVVHRTGYSPDSGWSRVEYNGEILYVVSSMIYTTEVIE